MLKVLIADDDPVTQAILQRLVSSWGYRVMTCGNGAEALDALCSDDPPGIAILDWSMPLLTGIEVCLKHQEHHEKRFVYKIVLSGVIERDEVIEALHSGAHDVMVKPIDKKLLRNRVEIANKICSEKIALENMNEVLQKYAAEMERLARERAEQLSLSDRIASLGRMSAGIAHEINNPLSFVAGNAQDLKMFWRDLSPLVGCERALQPSELQKLSFFQTEFPRVIESIVEGATRISAIVQGLKKFSSGGSCNRGIVDLNRSLDAAVELGRFSRRRDTTIDRDLATEALKVVGNQIEIEQVLLNLVVNASDATEALNAATIRLSSRCEENTAVIDVIDNGPGIPAAILSKIWDPFFTTKPAGKGTGLGLAICARIIQEHGGSIEASNIPEGGACFTVRLPIGLEKE